MDFWVVAAATGAGYVAKHWRNLSGEKENPPKLSVFPQSEPRQVFDKMPEPVFPLPKLARRCLLDTLVSSPETEDCELGENLPDHNELPVSGLKQVFQHNKDEINENREYFDTSSHHSHKYKTKKTNGSRPLVLTNNGRGQIGRPNDGLKRQVDNATNYTPREKSLLLQAELFEPVGSVKLPRRPKEMYRAKPFHSQGSDMVSLFMGITIGVLSTAVSNQREIEHLNELLEHAENLVQDLHNELERKDRPDEAIALEIEKIDSPKAENFELTSDIEAELEAELERLEENTKRQVFVEIDSDFGLDVARGDLKLDAVGWQLDGMSNSDHNNESQSVDHPVFTPNYVVSSLDLSLRLHELIESQLRSSVEELEAVLQNNNQSEPHSPIDSQEENSFWDFDHTRSFSPTP